MGCGCGRSGADPAPPEEGAGNRSVRLLIPGVVLATQSVVLSGTSERPFGDTPADLPDSGGESSLDRKAVFDERPNSRTDLERQTQALQRSNARLLSELERVREEAQRATRVKNDFLATMSHELRTPLNAIAGYTELLLLGVRGPLAPEQREDVERIAHSQRHLLTLITSILNFAKLDAGSVPYRMTAVAINDVLRDVGFMIVPQMEAKGVRYTQELSDAAVTAVADTDKVRQILLNLLSNAIKFTGSGGAVTVRCQADGTHVHVTVSDTGVGIARHKLEQIFEPFTQVDRTLSTTHEGVGLGLTISRDLARGMGGDLTVSSELDRGTTFTLTLRRG